VASVGCNPFAAAVDREELVCVEDFESMASRSFDYTYDGVKVGLEAATHLQRFDRFRRTLHVSGHCPLTKLQSELTWFADSAVPYSRFDQWQKRVMQPLLQQMSQQLASNQTITARGASSLLSLLLCGMLEGRDFCATFCKAARMSWVRCVAALSLVQGLTGLGIWSLSPALYNLYDISALPMRDCGEEG